MLATESSARAIAGIAKVHGEKVLTRNAKHFRGVEGVSVEPY
jgi:predicted nucleic acid-binding protein